MSSFCVIRFGAERHSLMYSWYNERDDFRSFHNLFKSQNIIVIRKIAKFISVLMKLTDKMPTETKVTAIQYR